MARGMTKEQWEAYAIRTFGSVEAGREAQRERGIKGGEFKGVKGTAAMPLEKRKEIATMGGMAYKEKYEGKQRA